MLSPIKNLKHKTNSTSLLKELIPKGSVVQSYPFYDGNIEFSLSESDRFVVGTTKSKVVKEFWECASVDPNRIASISQKFYPNLNENTFDLLKSNWYTYRDPYVRSALFFLLNCCSDIGMISYGEFDTSNYNPISLNYLKSFKADNFFIYLLEENEDYNTNDKADFNLFNGGNYFYDVLETEKIIGAEESEFRHTKFLKHFSKIPSIFVYNYHPRLEKNREYSKILVDQYGRKVNNSDNAKEIILYNVR
jgi:hypothetical protein